MAGVVVLYCGARAANVLLMFCSHSVLRSRALTNSPTTPPPPIPHFILQASRARHDGMDGSFNIRNDMRIFDCAKSRHDIGCKVMLVSGDTNVRTTALAAKVPAVKVESLWGMMTR